MTLDCPKCTAPVDTDTGICLVCARSQSTLALGSILASRYELRAVLGDGGIGVVYRAFDRTEQEEVALKVLWTDRLAHTLAVERFRAEIGLVRGTRHPNLGRILDHGETGPLAYLSMEILAGEDLEKILQAHPRGLPEAEALSAILQISSGLQAIHDAGALHGDLRTARARRDEHGVVRLLPFGMVKDPLAPGEAMGAPEYMSPEQCLGQPLDFRSDVYVLGTLAFEIFTGDVPLRGGNLTDTTLKQMQEMPSFDDEPGLRVPRPFVPALSRALAKAGPDRFVSVLEFAEALRSVAPEAALALVPGAASQVAAAIASPAPPPPPEVPLAPAPAPAPPVEAASPPAAAPPPQVESATLADPGPAPAAQTVAHPEPTPPSTMSDAPSPRRGSEDTRRDERFNVPTDVLLRKLSPSGEPEKEERTIAHDLSRSGMRLITSWTDLETGDQVALQEVGGAFSSQAVVRHVRLGTDRITRVGVEFVGTRAPDRLVGTTTGLARPAFDTSRSSSGDSRMAPAPIKPPSPPPISRPETSASIPRPRESASISRPERSAPIPRPVAPAVQTASVPRPGGLDQRRSTPAAAPRPFEEVREEIDTLCANAREMAGESKIWEALECLAKAQTLAEGTPADRAVRILTCETQARIPSLMRAAQQTLQDLLRSDPEDVAVHSALGRIFWRAGLSARARGAFSQVLTLDPFNREATAALATLSRAAKPS